ncbi:unnamed protein product [Diamesa tonsa]
MDKAEKLKAARKKLKEFQSSKPKQKQENEVETLVLENVTNVPQQDYYNPVSNGIENHKIPQLIQEPSTFQPDNYTNTTPLNVQPPQIASFFETESGNSFDLNVQANSFQEVQQTPMSYVPQQQQQQVEVPAQFEAPPQIEAQQQFTAQPQMRQEHVSEINKLNVLLENQSEHIRELTGALEYYKGITNNNQNIQQQQSVQDVDEIEKLKKDLQFHSETVKMLVSEKTSLTDYLQKSEIAVRDKNNENEELQGRLNASRSRVKQLEAETKQLVNQKQPQINHEAETQKIEEIVASRVREYQEHHERAETERSELKVQLNQKKIEYENLQKNFEHINTELHLSNVKIAQLSDSNAPVTTTDSFDQAKLNSLSQEVAMKNQQIQELSETINQMNRDKDSSDSQYQNYVSLLSRENETLKLSASEINETNTQLVKREQELVAHIGELERQMQQQIRKQQSLAAAASNTEEKPSELKKLEEEKMTFSNQLQARLEELKLLETRLEHFQTERPDIPKLMADIESDKIAASRAMQQNQTLKEQLEEMQIAFIGMSNDKLELTEKMQTEQHLCKEMRLRFESMESELQAVKYKWQFKDEEMIRLSHANTELEKNLLQQNIEIDRLRHYESKGHPNVENSFEKELENSKRLIETLTNKIDILETERKEHNHDHHHNHSHNHKHETTDEGRKHLIEEIETLRMEKNELVKAINVFQMNKKNSMDVENGVGVENEAVELEMNEDTLKKLSEQSITPSIATEEALEKLQHRFRRTMLEVADLSEEKQRLEHLVTQLQFETETIGEYITLYQFQRRLLKQKEYERDIQLKNLAADREKMNEKLHQLNSLIENYVLQHSEHIELAKEVHADNMELAKEASKFLNDNEQQKLINSPETLYIKATSVDLNKMKQETAGKILEILSDIKSTNTKSYDTNIGVENCSCCLGKLETV